MPPSGTVCVFCTHLQVRFPARKNKDIYLWRQWTCFKLLDLSQSPEKFGENLLKGMYLLRHLVPSLFAAQPSFVCQPEHQISVFLFSRLHNFRDFRRSSGSIVSLWTKGSSPWESWRNWRFFGAYNWLKNGPRMKMSILSYWKRGCSSCLPYPSLLLTKRVSQSPMISEILKDLESDVTEVPCVFPRTAGCRGGNHLVTTRMPWKQFLRWQGIPTRKNRLTCHEFFFFRIRGGSKWIHFQWRWVHYFVCLCGFSVGDLLLETGDSDEKKVWDQFVNLDFAKCKKIILWRRQSYLLNTLGCSPTQWPPGLLKHSWTMDTNYKTFTCWMSPSLTGYFEDHSRTCK